MHARHLLLPLLAAPALALHIPNLITNLIPNIVRREPSDPQITPPPGLDDAANEELWKRNPETAGRDYNPPLVGWTGPCPAGQQHYVNGAGIEQCGVAADARGARRVGAI